MARIQERVLTALQRFYDYVPPDRAPSEIEVDLPVSVVHDVGPDARFATGAGPWQSGFFHITVSRNHSSVATITNVFTPHNPDNVFQGIPDPFDDQKSMMWLYAAGGQVNDAADFANASISLQTSGDSIGMSVNPVPTPHEQLLFRSTISFEGVMFPSFPWPGAGGPIPLIRRPGGNDNTITFNSTSQAGGTVDISLGILVWLGSRFAVPPGM